MAPQIGVDRDTATISSGQSTTPAIALGARTLCGIAMPAGWDAAALTFLASVDGSTFLELTDTRSNGMSSSGLTVAVSQYLVLDPTMFYGLTLIKIRSGTSGSPVNQSADRTFTLVSKDIS